MTGLPAILVTGAAGDIGRAIARRLGAGGARVLGTDRAPRPDDHSAADWIAADISSPAGRASVIAAIDAPLAGFVHAAGIILTQGVAEITDADWDASLAVNVKAGFFLARDLQPRFVAGAALVMVGSVAGQRASPENLVYAASKAALRSMAASLSVAFAPQGLRVNVVAPGLIATGTTEAASQSLARLRGQDVAQVRGARVAGIPQGRAGSVDDVANAVAWLLSAEAAYVTGATIAVNGGLLAGS